MTLRERLESSELLETVAKGVGAKMYGNQAWELLDKYSRSICRMLAKVAITATLEQWKPYEEAAQVVEKWATYYPEDIFTPEGKTPDGIAGTALRTQLPKIAQEIRDLGLVKGDEQ